MVASVLSYIPSPPTSGISVGPLRLHVYGLLIAAGIAAAVWMSQRRWDIIGGRAGTMSALAVWGVPGGLIGARVYSLATSWNTDTNGHFLWAFELWRGGLGIWGGVIGGIALGWVGAYRAGIPIAPLLDCVAPAFALAQAVGRWGNYFNQELYGWQSSLPWAVKIDHPTATHMVAGQSVVYPPGSTFQPTFLYECIWDLIVFALVIAVERRFRIRRGYLITAYAALYTFGRFFTEYMRIDTAHRFWGLRLNDWTSVAVFVVALAVLYLRGRGGPDDDCAGDPLPSDAPYARADRAGSPGLEPPTHAGDETQEPDPIASESASGSGPT
ncbi:MAG TPA: prolipoprotein diacylglyceryl transferase [Acidimicrobiales bacterium]|jgi:prolipoprotein diacylglyceryl transferase|nr:prolipoprotein diacylglyceryl transferase [Acidimicrobiales bacterium]